MGFILDVTMQVSDEKRLLCGGPKHILHQIAKIRPKHIKKLRLFGFPHFGNIKNATEKEGNHRIYTVGFNHNRMGR